MSTSFRCVIIAAGLLVLGACPIASAQISLGIGPATHGQAEDHILRQLESRDAFEFEELPLTEFIQSLRDRFGINVQLDRRALDDQGIDAATPLSVTLRDASLESCLNLALESLDLTWTIRHESLVITTGDEAEASLATRVYPVRDLVMIEGQRVTDADFDSLIELITSTIQPDTWDEVGGPGAIESSWVSSSLVISQTWQNHRKIASLLTALRAARDTLGFAPIRVGSIESSPPKLSRDLRTTASYAGQWPRVYAE